MSDRELKSCPFCGSQAEWASGEQKIKYGNEQVYCPKCHATTPPEPSKTEAAQWWNARPDREEVCECGHAKTDHDALGLKPCGLSGLSRCCCLQFQPARHSDGETERLRNEIRYLANYVGVGYDAQTGQYDDGSLSANVGMFPHPDFHEQAARIRELDKWRLALESLTPGGSEFVGDLDKCMSFIRESREREHKTVVDAIKARKDAEAERLPSIRERALKLHIRELEAEVAGYEAMLKRTASIEFWGNQEIYQHDVAETWQIEGNETVYPTALEAFRAMEDQK